MAHDDDRHAWERPGAFAVADGVHRIPLPLPGDGLKAVNVYAIEQPHGIVLIDSGWAVAPARGLLEDGLAALEFELGDIRRILVTHAHRDHLELGMNLQRDLGIHLALGQGEQHALDELTGDPEPDHSRIMQRLREAGAGDLADGLEAHRAQRRRDGEVDSIDWRFPDEWLDDDQTVTLEGRELRVVATPGHTRGHVVFVDEAAGLLFAGDHVLPHITPSIGFEPVPVNSCLSDYLASLAIVRAMPDRRMLPAHGPVRETTHDRVDELLAHHEVRLKASHDAVVAGAETAYEVAVALPWTRRATAFVDLDGFNQMLAVNETAAHLDVLVRRDDLAVTEDPDGDVAVRRYSA